MNEIKLDLKDRKILFELDSNSRQPCSKIAKKVGLSTEVVNYRIKRLEEEKIITNYMVSLDLSKLGIIQSKILLSFQHSKSEEINKIIEEITKDNRIMWIASAKGKWDLIISGELKSIEELDTFKDDILEKFKNFINEKAIAICTGAEVYRRDFLLHEKSFPGRSRILVSNQKPVEIDEMDRKIINLLSENARLSLVEISSKLNSSPRVVNYRIKQLQKNKIITGFRIAIDYQKLGINFYKTLIYLDSPKRSRIEQLINYFISNPHVIHHVKVLGNWDLEPEFETSSEEQFNSILADIKDKFSDIIKKIDIVTISKEHKFVYF